MNKHDASNEFIDARYAKSDKYRQDMQEIQTAKVCPLCPETMQWHTKPILNSDNRWFVTENAHPYDNTARHLLIISREHRENLSEISPEDITALWGMVVWTINEFQIPGGALTMRFGDTTYTGATVKHLHMHLIVPDVENGIARPVYFPIG